MCAARSDDGLHQLEALKDLLQALHAAGEDPQIIGTTIVARSGRVGWSARKGDWVLHPFPKREVRKEKV